LKLALTNDGTDVVNHTRRGPAGGVPVYHVSVPLMIARHPERAFHALTVTLRDA
jgi:hypothetical protein